MSDEIIKFPDHNNSQTIIPPGHCACGCGGKTWNDSKFILGHNARVQTHIQQNVVPHQFKPGRTGNAKGRPRRMPITDAYRDLMNERYPGDPLGRTGAELLALAVFKAVVEEGSVGAAREITDRIEGPAGTPTPANPFESATEGVRAEINEFIRKLRANPMASEGTATGPGGDRAVVSPGPNGVSEPAPEGVRPKIDG